MAWTELHPGSILAREPGGKPKEKSEFWLPRERRFFIPEDSQVHARPVVVLKGDGMDELFTMIFYRDRIEGHYHGIQKVLVEL